MLLEDETRFHPPRAMQLKWRLDSMPNPARRALSGRRRPDTFTIGAAAEEVGTPPVPVPNTEKWFEALYGLCADGKRGPAVDLVLDAFDELLVLQDEAKCNELLKLADVERLRIEVLLAFLMATFRTGSALRERAGFYDRVANKVHRDSPDRREALLGRLK